MKLKFISTENNMVLARRKRVRGIKVKGTKCLVKENYLTLGGHSM